jgi:capsule polysaccharide export protein KpsE/RkpR
LNRLTAELSTSAARREREFLEGRLLSVRVELDQSSKQLSEFSSQNVTFDPKEQGKATFEAAAKLQAELISAQAQLSGLEQIYAPQNVRVRAVRAKIAELQRQLNSLASGPEKNGASEVESSYPSLRKLPGLGVTYYNLYRDVKIQESIFEVLTKQLELAKVQEAKEVPTIRVLDAANLPESKASPKRLNLIILGCILSLLMSSIYLMVAHRWRALSDENAAKAVVAEIRKNITLDDRLFSRFARLPVVRSVLGRRLHWKRMSS